MTNDFNGDAASAADIEVDVEDPFESLRPGHRRVTVGGVAVSPAWTPWIGLPNTTIGLDRKKWMMVAGT